MSADSVLCVTYRNHELKHSKDFRLSASLSSLTIITILQFTDQKSENRNLPFPSSQSRKYSCNPLKMPATVTSFMVNNRPAIQLMGECPS